MEKYEVFATVTIPVSLSFEAKNDKDAIEKAHSVLSADVIVSSELSLIRADRKIIKPYTHDYHVKIDGVIEI